MSSLKRAGLAAAAVSLLGTMVLGCGKEEPAQQGATAAAVKTPEAKQKISVMYNLYGNAPKKTEAWKFIEDKLNIELDLMAVPDNSYKEKVNVTIASGQLPDAMLWHLFPSPEFSRLLDQKALLPLDDYIKDAPNLQKYPKELWDNLRVNGKIWGIPRPRAISQTMVVIRKDWLDKLGLPIPKTTDDFFKTAVAFANNDPDGNGKKDTVGMVLEERLGHAETLFHAFDSGYFAGNSNGYRIMEDGTLMNERITPGRKEAIKWLRDLYAAGGIDRDFPTMKKTNIVDRMISGKAGMELGAALPDFGRAGGYVEGLSKVDPKAEFIIVDAPVGPTDKSGYSQTMGFFGQWVIPANTPTEKVKKIVELLDWEASEEGQKLKSYGIEGVHHKKEADGKMTLIKEKYDEDAVSNVITHNPYDPYYGLNKTAPQPIQDATKKGFDMIKSKLITNPAITFLAPTSIEKNASLEKILQEYEVKIILGELPLEKWDEMKQKWLDNGGAQIQKEVNDWYKANKK